MINNVAEYDLQSSSSFNDIQPNLITDIGWYSEYLIINMKRSLILFALLSIVVKTQLVEEFPTFEIDLDLPPI